MLDTVLTGEVTFKSLRPPNLSSCTKEQLRAYFENSYNINESLFTSLKDESVFYKCPDRLRLPLIFYFGHTACVYMNKLILTGLLKESDRVNRGFETIFETGVDEMSWDDTENYRMGGKYDWPSLEEVVKYRLKMREIVLQVIEDTPLKLPIDMNSPWWGLMMGIEHERIHIETSSVLIRQLPVDMLEKPPQWQYGPITYGNGAGKNELIHIETSDISFGKPFDFPSYGWDNEYGIVECKVPAFESSRYLITNRELLAFVREGGYKKQEFWTEEGWNWVQFREAKHPTFWVCNDGCKAGCGAALREFSHCVCKHCKVENYISNGQNGYCNGHESTDDNGHQGRGEGGGHKHGEHEYRLRVMFDEIDMPWDWPVEVNYLEAKAFCTWKGPEYRLPAEAEWNVMKGSQRPPSDGTVCDIIYQDKLDANLNLQYGSSTPVNMHSPSSRGIHDLHGNTWEWVEDHFNGLPGFKSSHLYDDFSAPCFDGRHNLILGGSWVSTGDEASRFARFAFRRHFFQHLGFRIAKTVYKGPGKLQIPIRLVTDRVFVIGAGVQENPVTLPKNVNFIPVDTTYTQYHYEKEEYLNDMLQYEYGSHIGFPVQLAEKCGTLIEKYGIEKDEALHIGCGTGKTTFTLAKYFQTVFGQDFCARFVDTCQKLQTGKVVNYTCMDGFKKSVFEAKLPADVRTDNITFKVLTWLPNEVDKQDFILVTSFDRVQNVQAWTVRLTEVLKKTGLLVVASGGQWGEDALSNLIGDKFQLMETDDMAYTEGIKGRTARITVWKHSQE